VLLTWVRPSTEPRLGRPRGSSLQLNERLPLPAAASATRH